MMRRFFTIAGLVFAQPAYADVVMTGPPMVQIKLTRAQVGKMVRDARAATRDIFDFSRADRPAYLNAAYAAASGKGITGIDKIVSVSVIGDRAFVLAVAPRYLAPQVVGQTYTYMQCRFDESGRVIAIDVDL